MVDTPHKVNGRLPAPVDDPIDKPLPQEPESEEALAGAAVLGFETETPVQAQHFLSEKARQVWWAATQIRAEAGDCDAPAVIRQLEASGAVDKLFRSQSDAAVYVIRCTELVSEIGLELAASRVVDAYRRRKAIAALTRGLKAAYTPDADLSEFAELIGDEVEAQSAGPRPVSDLIRECGRKRRPIVIDGLLRRTEVLNLIGHPKAGKTWAAIDLALSVSQGQPWLGRQITDPGPVLIIDAELDNQDGPCRIADVADARQFDPARIDGLECWYTSGSPIDVYGIERHCRRLKPGSLRLIVVDALYRFLPAGCDENSNRDIAEVYAILKSIAVRLECAIVCVHHATKGNQGGKRVTDVGSGAGAMSRAADAHLTFREHVDDEDAAILSGVVRSFPRPKDVGLRWTFPVWHVDDQVDTEAVATEGAARAKARRAEKRRADEAQKRVVERGVVEALTSTPQGDTVRSIATRTGQSVERTQVVIEQLRRAGRIRETHVKRANGQTYPGVALNEQ